jgi:hypothetical protein
MTLDRMRNRCVGLMKQVCRFDEGMRRFARSSANGSQCFTPTTSLQGSVFMSLICHPLIQ